MTGIAGLFLCGNIIPHKMGDYILGVPSLDTVSGYRRTDKIHGVPGYMIALNLRRRPYRNALWALSLNSRYVSLLNWIFRLLIAFFARRTSRFLWGRTVVAMTKGPTRDDVLRKMLKTPPKPFTPKASPRPTATKAELEPHKRKSSTGSKTTPRKS